MKSPFFNVMRTNVPSPTKFVQLLQDQQLDTVQTSVKAMSCRDPMSLVQLQQAFMQRMVERWAKMAPAETEKPAEPEAKRPAKSEAKSAAKSEAKPVARSAPKLEPVPPPANEPPATHPVAPDTTEPVAAQDHAPSPHDYDDLTVIRGIGPKFAKTLNEHGITSYKQLAALTPDEIESLEEKLGFSGRFAREGWVEQARELAH